MTKLEKLIEAYNQNGGKAKIIRRLKDQAQAEAFRAFLLMEIYRHLGDVHDAMQDIEAVTKAWDLPPETLDADDLNCFFKVVE
jgi:hypothetical protein